jgi:hypothetical protein
MNQDPYDLCFLLSMYLPYLKVIHDVPRYAYRKHELLTLAIGIIDNSYTYSKHRLINLSFRIHILAFCIRIIPCILHLHNL